jgi:hypothetical protein
VIDVSDPSRPRRVAAIDYEGSRTYSFACLAYGSEHLYATVADKDQTLLVFDLSDPAQPTRTATLDLGGAWATELLISDDILYVLAWGSLRTYDVSDPANPRLLDDLDVGGYGMDLAAGVLLVVGDRRPLAIADVSDPSAIENLARHPLGRTSLFDIAGYNGKAVAIGEFGLFVFDVASPTGGPKGFGTYATGPRGMAIGVGAVGEYAFLTDETALRSFDLRDPSAPVELSSIPMTGFGGYSRLAVVGDRAYVAHEGFRCDGGGLLSIADVSVPEDISLLGYVGMHHEASALAVEGDYAYLAGIFGINPENFSVRNVAAPATGEWTGDVRLEFCPESTETLVSEWGHAIYSVAAAGEQVYVGLDGSGISVVDVRDPSAPTELGCWRVHEGPYGLTVHDRLLYVAEAWHGVEVYDLSLPHRPTLLSTLATPGSAQSVHVDEGRAYIADGPRGVTVYDVSDPGRPFVLGHIELPGNTIAVAVFGEMIVAATHHGGMVVVRARLAPAVSSAYLPAASRSTFASSAAVR